MKSIAKQLSAEQASQYLMMSEEVFWGDLKNQTLIAVKSLINSSMDIQIQDLTNAKRWQRSETRLNYRNGYYTRDLLTSLGWIKDIKIPRIRKSNPCLQLIPRYKQRTKDIDMTVLNMFLAGVSTRRVEEVLKYILGDKSISCGTVSNIVKKLDKLVNKYHNRPLKDDYSYLIIDGVYISSKSITGHRKRCVIVAYGITTTGQRELIDYELTRKGESENAYSGFLNRLYYRGLKGKNLKLIVTDGNKGLHNAIEIIYPFAKIQRCWAHKLRNVSNYLPKKLQYSCIAQARNIYDAENKQSAIVLFKQWYKTWYPICPKAVQCLEKDIDNLLHFYDCPKYMHKKLRTTNIIERVFREVRRRTRPIGCFTNTKSVDRIVFAIFNRQNKIWQKNTLWKENDKPFMYKYMSKHIPVNIDNITDDCLDYSSVYPKFTHKF